MIQSTTETHCETDFDKETGQTFCLSHQAFVCRGCDKEFEPQTDYDTTCLDCTIIAGKSERIPN